MMERLEARLRAMAAARGAVVRGEIAERLREALPGDVTVSDEDAGVVLRGWRIGIRWVRDRGFAVLRDGGWW